MYNYLQKLLFVDDRVFCRDTVPTLKTVTYVSISASTIKDLLTTVEWLVKSTWGRIYLMPVSSVMCWPVQDVTQVTSAQVSFICVGKFSLRGTDGSCYWIIFQPNRLSVGEVKSLVSCPSLKSSIVEIKNCNLWLRIQATITPSHILFRSRYQCVECWNVN